MLLLLACVAIGIQWFRALSRVRASIRHRMQIESRVSAVLARLNRKRVDRTVASIVTVQAAVRAYIVRLRVVRHRAMLAYEGLGQQRTWLVCGAQTFAAVYILLCLYVIALFGTSVFVCLFVCLFYCFTAHAKSA